VVVGRRVVGVLSTYDLLRLLQDVLAGRVDFTSTSCAQAPNGQLSFSLPEVQHVQRI
jgi:hypothetical protein